MTRLLVSLAVSLLLSLGLAGCVTPTTGTVRCEWLPDGSWACSTSAGGQADTDIPGM